MDTPTLLNYAGGIIMAGITWWVNTIWGDMKSLKSENASLRHELGEFKTQVARDCVAKADLEKITERVFDKLDDLSKDINHISRNQAQVKTLADALRDFRGGHDNA